jgi:hypothetical protein
MEVRWGFHEDLLLQRGAQICILDIEKPSICLASLAAMLNKNV